MGRSVAVRPVLFDCANESHSYYCGRMANITRSIKATHRSATHSSGRPSQRRPVARNASLGLALAGLVIGAGACGDGSDSGEESGTSEQSDVTVVVTSNILGDVVSEMVGDLAEVETIMGEGSDPHQFQASAKQANEIREADVVVANGAGFEEGLVATLESAHDDGVVICEAIDSVETIDPDEDGHADDEAGEHADEHADEHGDEHDHEHEGADPHFFTDPARMAQAVSGLAGCMAGAVPALDTAEFTAQTDAYVAELEELDSELESLLAGVPEDQRILVTNHEVFNYFADRYDFEVAGAIVPSVSTQGQPDAASLAELADVVRTNGVPAVFAETTSREDLAEALAGEVGDVEVVTLFSESLGPDGGESYVAMMRTNAERIAGALG